jgi:hypothetical protein
VADGHGPQLYDLELQRSLTNTAIVPYHRQLLLPYIYPAYVAVLLSPLGKMSLVKAFLVWSAINVVCAVWLAWRLACGLGAPKQLRGTFLLAFCAWVPLQLTLSHGQTGLLSAVALTEAMRSLEAGKRWKAGCWLALGLAKPQLIAFPLLALLLWRCWAALTSFAAVLLCLLAVSWARAGFWIGGYLRFLVAFNRSGKALSLYPVAMPNWRGLIYLILGSDNSMAAHLLLAAVSAGSVLLAAIVCLGRVGAADRLTATPALPARWKERLALTTLLGLLASPYLYFHDWVISLPALWVLFLAVSDAPQREAKPRLVVLLIALSPFVCLAAQFGVWPSASPMQLAPSYMGLFAVVAIMALRRGEPTGSRAVP